MGIFNCVSDIISANLDDLAGHNEDPERMLKQAVQEIEISIEVSRHSLAMAIAREKRVAKCLVENQQLAKQWESRAELAIAAGCDDLALKAILRRQEHDKVASALADQHDCVAEANSILRRQLNALQVKLAEAKRRLEPLVIRKWVADVQARGQAGLIYSQDSNEMAAAEADALRELSGEVESECQAELLKMKQRFKK